MTGPGREQRPPDDGAPAGASSLPGLSAESAERVSLASGRVLRNTFVMIAQPLLLNLLGIAVTGYIARTLGALDFGRLNYAFAMSALFASLAGLGIGTVTVRDLVQRVETAPALYLGRTLVLRLVAGTVAFAALAVTVLAGGLLPGAPWAVLVAGATIFPTVITVSIEDLFRAREQMHHIARVRLIAGLLLTASSVVALLAGGRLATLVGVYAAASFVTFALATHTLVRHFFVPRLGFDLGFARRILTQGSVFFAGGLLSSISQRIDKVILERLRGTASVGEFVAGASLVEKLAIIPEGLGGATYPALAGLVDRDRGAARVALARFLTLAALIGLPTALGGVLVAGPLIRLIFGSGFPEAVAVFAVAVWVLPAWSFLQVLNVALIAVHQERKVLVVTAAGTVLLLVGNLLLVPLLGTLGSAVALCGSQWFVTLVLFVLVFRLYGQVLEPRPLLHIFTGLLVMSVGVLLTHQLPLFVQTAVGVAIYLAAIWPQARELLRLVRPARSVRPPGPLC